MRLSMPLVFLSSLAVAQAAVVETSVPGSSCSAAGVPEATSALLQKNANRVNVKTENLDESAAEETRIEDRSNNSGIANSDSGDYSSSYHTTNWDSMGKGRVIFFDRHDVSCKDYNGALQGFKLDRNGDNIRYTIKCSGESTWVKKEDRKKYSNAKKVLLKEGYLSDYWSMLKHQSVKCDDGYVLDRFQLRTMHPPKQTWTDTLLNNFRVAFDIFDAIYPDTVNRAILMWYEYECVRVNTQNFQSREVHWALNKEYYCQSCRELDQGYNSMYLDRSTVMAPNNGLMKEFWSYSIDTENYKYEFKFLQKT